MAAAEGGKIRSFIAFDLDPAITERVHAFLAECRQLQSDIRWVRPDGLHVTLKFLGWVEPHVLESVRDTVKAVALRQPPMRVRASGLGAFPSLRRPRVLWVGLQGAEMTVLAAVIDAAVAGLGFEPERRPFAAHLTLGRVNGMRGWSRVEELFHMHSDDDFGTSIVDAVTVYRSTLRPDGAVYTPLWTIQLGGHKEGAIS